MKVKFISVRDKALTVRLIPPRRLAVVRDKIIAQVLRAAAKPKPQPLDHLLWLTMEAMVA